MEHDDESELARILAGVSLETDNFSLVDDQTFLQLLNALRRHEQQAPLTDLPQRFKQLTPLRRQQWLKRIVEETNLHAQHTDTIPTPLIFLNKTEIHLITLNRTFLNNTDTVPLTTLPYAQVDPEDLPFYYPSQSDKTAQVFVTNSDTRLIGTPTYVSSGKYIAPHALHNTGLQNITPLEFIQPIFGRSSTPDNLTKTDTDSSTTSSDSSSNPFYQIKMSAEEEVQKAQAAEQKARAKVVELEEEITQLTNKLQSIKVTPTEKPKAKSEREEISDLKKFITHMVRNVESSTGIDLNATVEEKQFFDSIKESTEDENPKLMYKLHRPDNILDPDTKREPPTLQILKPSVIANTIGTFDPDVNPSLDFKGTWERIIDHTKSFDMYEHEYITILRMVMKGSAASSLDKITRECQGDLTDTLEAIQDLYIPQLTVFDEFDELNHFTRRKGEHIRTAMRRASMAVFPLRETVTKAAWPDRRYHLLKSMLNQMLDKKTLRHLQMKEKECVQQGTQLSIESMIQIISLYESTHDLLPYDDIKMRYNVNTMYPLDAPDKNKTEMDDLKDTITSLKHDVKSLTSLTAKRPRPNDPLRHVTQGRQIVKAKRKLDSRGIPMDTSQSSQQKPQTRSEHTPTQQTQLNTYTPKSNTGNQQRTYSQQQYSQNRGNYQSNRGSYRSNQGPRYNTSYRGNNYRGRGGYRGTGQRNGRGNSQYTNTSYRGSSQYVSPNYRGKNPRTYTFRHNDHDITLKFFKCGVCPSMHPEGTGCPHQTQQLKAITLNP